MPIKDRVLAVGSAHHNTWPTRFEARPDVWKVSPDKKGDSPAGCKNSG